jgi:hypothetical protein
MKKILIISIAVLMLAIGLTACSENLKTTQELNQTEDAQNDAQTSDTEPINDTEELKEADEEVADKVDEEVSSVDKNLTGFALLESIKFNAPKEFVMTTETTMPDGSIAIATTYTKGTSTRMETKSAMFDGKMIMIYNADEGATYQYTEGETTGILMLDGEEQMDMDMDMSAPTLKDLVDASSEDITAKMDMLDGEEVIYIEATEADEDMGEGNVYMWYSVKYSVPLKYEFYLNDQLVASAAVTHIDAKEKLDDALFQKPEGVEFQEFSFDNMFGE